MAKGFTIRIDEGDAGIPPSVMITLGDGSQDYIGDLIPVMNVEGYPVDPGQKKVKEFRRRWSKGRVTQETVWTGKVLMFSYENGITVQVWNTKIELLESREDE